jgi:catechol 2,3-dioxygenase-like lactoylglutathione lyase family enzyme
MRRVGTSPWQSREMPPVSWMHAFVDVPVERVDEARSFWSSVLGWPPGEAWPGHPEFVSLMPPDGAPYAHVQRIDGPPRVHLDVVGEIERDTARLEKLGATPVYRGAAWQALTSPAGLPFCVCAESWPHERPQPVAWPGGYRSRLVQLTIDVPGELYAGELDFWRAATGWADEAVDAPEFHRLVHRAESPLQLLVQRLGPDDPARRARAHLDLGTDDMDAEIDRVRSLGARVLWARDGFVALRDPLGLPFCVTGNDP